jgi:hypothetical protein
VTDPTEVHVEKGGAAEKAIRDGVARTMGPVTAADVAPESGLTPEELEEQRRRKAVASRMARRAGLRAGGMTGLGTDAVQKAEDSLAELNARQQREFRERKKLKDAIAARVS